MSKDVSLVFGVNVDESTQVIKSQLQGIFEEINKQPHSIRVAIDGASFNNAINKLQEIRQLMSETDTFRGTEHLLDGLIGSVNRVNGQVKLTNDILVNTKNAFAAFADDGIDGITRYQTGISSVIEELMRLRNIVSNISMKDFSPQVSGGFTGVDTNNLGIAASRLDSLNGYAFDLTQHLGEIKTLLSGISTTISSITSQTQSSEGGITLITQFQEKIENMRVSLTNLVGFINYVNNEVMRYEPFKKLSSSLPQFQEGLQAVKNKLLDIETLIGKLSTSGNSFNDANEIFKFSENLERIKGSVNSISGVLEGAFKDSEGKIITLEDHLARITEYIDLLRYGISGVQKAVNNSGGGSWFQIDQMKQLESIQVNVESLVQVFSELKQTLIEISGLISQINSKDFNITNKFSVPKVDNTKKEIALVKQESIETYRVVEQLINAFETLSKGSHKQELFGALLNSGGQYDNIYSVLTALDQLGTSIEDIQKKQRLDGLNAIKTQLNGLLTDLTNLVNVVNANTNIKILSPDISNLTKAREELEALRKESESVEVAARQAALNAMTANPTTITTIRANLKSSADEAVNTVTSNLNGVKSQVDTFVSETNEKLSRVFSLSDTKTSTTRAVVFANEIKSIIDSMITEISGKLNGLFEMQKLSGVSEQVAGHISKIQTEFESLKIKVIEGITEIQTALNSITVPQITTSGFSLDNIRESLSTLKTEISSVMVEVKSAIDTTLGSISSSKIALPVENIKEYLTVLESIQSAHGGMGEVAAQFKDLATAIQSTASSAGTNNLEPIITGVNSLVEGVNSLNAAVGGITDPLNKFVDSLASLGEVEKGREKLAIYEKEVLDLIGLVERYSETFREFNSHNNLALHGSHTVGSKIAGIGEARIVDIMSETITSFKDSMSTLSSAPGFDENSMKDNSMYGMIFAINHTINKIISEISNSLKAGKTNIEELSNYKEYLIQILKLYEDIRLEYNKRVDAKYKELWDQYPGGGMTVHSNSGYRIEASGYAKKAEYSNLSRAYHGAPTQEEIIRASTQFTEYSDAKKEAASVKIVEQDEVSMLERYADIINEIKNQFDLLKTDVVKGLTEIKTAISSLPKEMKITIGGKGAADLKAQTAEIQNQTEAEKALTDAAAAEEQAEEGRKISLSQFLDLYTKLQKYQNTGTHIKESEQYAAVQNSLEALLPVYDLYKDKVQNIKNIIEGAEAVMNVPEGTSNAFVKAFDAGTIALKQFEAAIPSTADGVKIQDALKALDGANKVIGAYEKAGGSLENGSYSNLVKLVGTLSGKIDESRTKFAELGSNAHDAGDKISEILRQIAIESENVKVKTNEVTEQMKDEAAIAKELAAAEREMAQEQQTLQNAYSKTSSLVASMTGVLKTVQTSQKQGVDVTNTRAFEEVTDYVNLFKDALAMADREAISVIEAIDRLGLKLGVTSEDAFDKAQIAVNTLKTALNETGTEAQRNALRLKEDADIAKELAAAEREAAQEQRFLQEVYNKTSSSIVSMTGVLKTAQAAQKQGVNVVDTQSYKDVANYVQLFKNSLELADKEGISAIEAINREGLKLGVTFEDVFEKSQLSVNVLKTALNEAGIEVQRTNIQMREEAAIAKELADAEREAAQEQQALQTAYSKTSSSVASMTGLLKTAKNQTPKAVDFEAYKEVSAYVDLFKNSLELVDKESISVIEAIDRLGTELGVTSEDAFNKAQLSVYALKTALNETDKEISTTSPKVIALSQAYNTLNSISKLRNENVGLKNTEQYKELTYYVYTLEKAINDAMSSGKSLDEVFLKSKIDGVQFFENLKVSTAQFNNLIINSEREVTTLTKAYSRMASLEKAISNADTEAKKTAEYEAAQKALDVLSKAISTAEEKSISITKAFELLRINGKSAMEDVELATVKLQRVITHTDTTSIKDVLGSITKYDSLLQSNSNLKGTSTIYGSMSKDVNTLRLALSEAESEGKLLDNVITSSGERVIDVLDRLEISALRFKDEINQTGVSGNITLSRLYKELAAIENLMNSAKTKPAAMNTNEYTALVNIVNTTKDVIDKVENKVLTLEGALKAAGTNGTKYLNDIALATNRFKVKLAETEKQVKTTTGAQTNSANSAEKQEKARQQALTKSLSLLNKMQAAEAKWTAARTGKTSRQYSALSNDARELSTLIQRYKEGNVELSKFKDELERLTISYNNNSRAIIGAGENTRSFAERFGNFSRYFGMWFGFSRLIMQTISSIKQMITTSIELDDAFTQLQIVTQDTKSSYEAFGDTVAKVAKRTATSMADITSSATTFARLGFSLEDSAKIAEYTAKLQNVGDIEVSDAQDAITAILKAYDLSADKMEDIMNKLVTTGNHFPISVSQIAEGMNNASSALAAAGNSFDQSVALLTAANVTINLCRVA